MVKGVYNRTVAHALTTHHVAPPGPAPNPLREGHLKNVHLNLIVKIRNFALIRVSHLRVEAITAHKLTVMFAVTTQAADFQRHASRETVLHVAVAQLIAHLWFYHAPTVNRSVRKSLAMAMIARKPFAIQPVEAMSPQLVKQATALCETVALMELV